MSTICITWASNGIGEALAYSYARPDNHLILIARNAERLEQIKAQCEKYGSKTTIAIINVCNHQALHDFLIDIDNQDPIHRKRRYLGRYFAHPMMQNRRAKRDDYKPSAVRVTQRCVP
ncbi:short chain dehydrogenase [Piscirickettsia salmonis]|uniref:SDR family NAD(P)-dependent oxidoreductase n=2 Tax=Piscirickettsia salmonis TaxID=1238 RepID=UPI0012B81926|nr:SDR family NAD(P)-dependent oxidoreductase [Piscirickettsia salmonis]QGP51988.1 short chain dehydrogenase [Piscirickettsia salmonis]